MLIAVACENQLLPGTLEVALQALVARRRDTAIFESRDKDDDPGCRAADPKMLLTVMVLAYARGLLAARKIEQACRENLIFMALACGPAPDHLTIAAVVTSLKLVTDRTVGMGHPCWREPKQTGEPWGWGRSILQARA